MADLWNSLPATAQDIALLIALLLPAGLTGAVVLWGYAPWPLTRAILKRFRWASLLFTLLIAVSVGMGIGLLAQERGLRRGTAQAADKFDLVISAPGSEITMLMAAVYLQPTAVPLLSGDVFQEVATAPNVQIAAPLAFGDSYRRSPIVGTTPDFVTHLAGAPFTWQSYEDAIAGAAVPLAVGDTFTPAHGLGPTADHGAHGTHLKVTAKLPRTGTPWDKAILLPIETVWEIHGLANGHAPDQADQIGPPFDADYFPGTPAIIVRAETLWANYSLQRRFTRADTMAFFPGTVLSRLYMVMGDVRQAMSLMSLVTQVLVAASVLLGLFILTRLFTQQMALLRALGAPARFVLAVVWSFAATLLAAGALGGLALGFIAAQVLSRILSARTDILITAPISWPELHLVAGFISATLILALLPALAVLRQPVVKGLRG